MEKGFKIFIVVVVILLLILTYLLYVSFGKPSIEDLCEDFDGCDVYSCYARHVIFVPQQRNLLLAQQNCLLKEGLKND